MMFFNAIPRHPHVVSIIDAFVDEEQLVIVFEYMACSLMHMWDRAQDFWTMTSVASTDGRW